MHFLWCFLAWKRSITQCLICFSFGFFFAWTQYLQHLSRIKASTFGYKGKTFSSAFVTTALFSGSRWCSTLRMRPVAGSEIMNQPLVCDLLFPFLWRSGGGLSPRHFTKTFSCPSAVISVTLWRIRWGNMCLCNQVSYAETIS